jgi:rsbT co-antagonist protein RsbR
MQALTAAAQKGIVADLTAPQWTRVRDILADLSASRVKNGYSPSETAEFVFSLKKPLFTALLDEFGKDADALGEALWQATEL